jgi:hypothetical protein
MTSLTNFTDMYNLLYWFILILLALPVVKLENEYYRYKFQCFLTVFLCYVLQVIYCVTRFIVFLLNVLKIRQLLTSAAYCM